jgi:uncharacterized membrane protein
MTRWIYLAIVFTLLAGLGSFYVHNFRYDDLPAQVPIHWNLQGNPDGFVPKSDAFLAFWLLPLVMAGLVGLTLLLPWLSPRHFEVDRFRSIYGYVMMLAVAVMGYIHFIVLWGSLHAEMAISRLLVGGLCLFFVLLGAVLGKVRRNFWIGVRTPWTLADEEVWDRTHRLSARLFGAAGLFGVLAALAGLPLVVCFVGILVGALVPVIYSLVVYKQLERQGRIG